MQIDIDLLLRTLGIVAEYNKRSGRWIAKCPSPDHDDSRPSWYIVDKPGDDYHGSHHCFSCKFGGGPWELSSVVWDCSLEDAFKRLKKIFDDGRVPDQVPGVRILNGAAGRAYRLPIGVVIPDSIESWYKPALDYLIDRGVTYDQIKKYCIGYSIRGRLANRVVFPVHTNGELKTYSARSIIKSEPRRYDMGLSRQGAKPKSALFGEPYFDLSFQSVVVAEGIFSALALERAGGKNICALLGSNVSLEKIRIISKFRDIIVVTDPDEAGDNAYERINILSRRNNVYRLRMDRSPDDMSEGEMSKYLKNFY